MTLIGYRAKNHPQQVARRGANREVDDRMTPRALFEELDAEFGFTIDVAAAPHNAQVSRFLTLADDGLSVPWGGERVWCNPPFSDIAPWIRKAWSECEGGVSPIVMLLPANRTDQVWWHELVEPYRDREGSPLRTRFLPGRPRFLGRHPLPAWQTAVRVRPAGVE